MTPIVCLLILLVGLCVGYYARPTIELQYKRISCKLRAPKKYRYDAKQEAQERTDLTKPVFPQPFYCHWKNGKWDGKFRDIFGTVIEENKERTTKKTTQVKENCLFIWLCGFFIFLIRPFISGEYYGLLFLIGIGGIAGMATIFLSSGKSVMDWICKILIPLLGATMLFAVGNILSGNLFLFF